MDMSKAKVTVVGGGIAGLTAAWELARFDIDVTVVEKSPFLGGHAIGFCCKAAENCLQCGACSVEGMLKNVIETPSIKIYRNSEACAVEDNAGQKLSVRKKPQYIDPEKCTNCGVCLEKCPEDGAILKGFSRNNIPVYAISYEKCRFINDNKSCRECESHCPEKAIDLDAPFGEEQLESDAVVIASGFTPFNPAEKPVLGYQHHENMITGLELEHQIRTTGGAYRPSDGAVPEKIAFIQCVGSRDESLGHLWCSQVCCAYALRMSENIKYRHPESDVSIFYMDIQNTGRDSISFYEKCRLDLRFVRTIPVDVFPADQGRMKVRYMTEEDGKPQEELFDLVVLSIGIMPGKDNQALSDMFGITLNREGFFLTPDPLVRSLSTRKGVFLAGTAAGPRSIPASMAHAGQAAADVMKYLRGLNG